LAADLLFGERASASRRKERGDASAKRAQKPEALKHREHDRDAATDEHRIGEGGNRQAPRGGAGAVPTRRWEKGKRHQPRAARPRGRRNQRRRRGARAGEREIGDEPDPQQHDGDEREHAEAAEPRVTHDLEAALDRGLREEPVGRIGEPVLVHRAGDQNAAGHGQDRRDRGTKAEAMRQEKRQRHDEADERARDRDGRRHPGKVEIAPRTGLLGKARNGKPRIEAQRLRQRDDETGARRGKAHRAALPNGRETAKKLTKQPAKKPMKNHGGRNHKSTIMNKKPTTLPFDDIRALVAAMPGPDEAAIAAVRARDAVLTKPPGSLGRLETIAEWLAAWQGRSPPKVERALVAVFAGNHGVVNKGVSAFPASVTQQMVANFAAGGAAINQICASFDLGLKVFDLALDLPTGDITEGPALEEAACAATMAFGMEAIAGGVDLLALGEMGIGNTTIAAAIYTALYGGPASRWTGRGTGLDDAGLKRKAAAIEAAMARHQGHLADPLEVLRRVGGREIAAIAGAILAARTQRIPVILDGYVVTAAACVLHALDPHTLDHCLAGHRSAEGAHAEVLERLGLEPLLDLDMRLGEGSGAALAAGIVKAAARCHSGMATFTQAGVDEKSA
jgi:nicotinate-nucleotide--dimethylbenzimidazole phosphoribosyltransferase